jgi:CRP-like cAMP-binding protein
MMRGLAGGVGAVAHPRSANAQCGMAYRSPLLARNRLLAALSAEETARITPSLEPVEMPLAHVVYESGRMLDHVYFPTTCIVSLMYVLESGASTGIAVVGTEGAVGISVFMGGESSPSRGVVQSAGEALRLPAAVVREEFRRGGAMQDLMLRYTQSLTTQVALTAVCNRHHSVAQQLSRWLLLSIDRLPTADIVTTQELIASMIGVRREGVTEAAGKLQKEGVIRYSRGHITVLDRPRLEALCCECYEVVRRETARLLPSDSSR